jgi:hypothetical protein
VQQSAVPRGASLGSSLAGRASGLRETLSGDGNFKTIRDMDLHSAFHDLDTGCVSFLLC